MTTRLNSYQLNPKAIDTLASMKALTDSISDSLIALVELRVSQINGCVYCVDLHSNQLRDLGENIQRIDCVAAWDECPFFDEKEKAAFAWAESLTHVSTSRASDSVYSALQLHFSDREIVDLTMVISVMNSWNRISVGLRSVPELRE